MRAGTLSDPAVAALLEEGFVCAWEKKGAVECYRVKGDPKTCVKVGGNILSYVCTARGEVIHAIPGAPARKVFVDEIENARAIWRETAVLEAPEAADRLRSAHRERPLNTFATGMDRVHELLSRRALLPVGEVERDFFMSLLGQVYAPKQDIVIREIDPRDFDALMRSMPRG